MSNTKKIRILQREDGAIFTFDSAIEGDSRMRPGWLTINANGGKSVTLDAATSVQLDPNNATARESSLIEENADLRARVAELQGLAPPPAATIPAPIAPAPELAPGESALPGGDVDTVLPSAASAANAPAAPAPTDEKPTGFADESGPSHMSKSLINRMGADRCVEHLGRLGVVAPEGAAAQELRDLCLTTQEQQKATPAS